MILNANTGVNFLSLNKKVKELILGVLVRIQKRTGKRKH